MVKKPQSNNQWNSYWEYARRTLNYLHNNISAVNNSKFFAGFIIIVLNISSKFVSIKLSKTMESYLKHTFSKQILVFAIAWMGTRDIYYAFIVMLVFTLFAEYFFNEDSALCIFPHSFKQYHLLLLDESENKVTDEEIQKAQLLLKKARTVGRFID